jgi:uncharacterized protein (DUF927 family)
MANREWIPSSKQTPCYLCSNTSGWCSTSAMDENTIICKNFKHAPQGWTKLKDTTDGGGVFKTQDSSKIPDSYQPEIQDNDEHTEYQPADHTTRDRIYRRLIQKNGDLSTTYREDLRWRGLDDRQIDDAVHRQWLGNWQRGIVSDFACNNQNIAGINPSTSKTCGCDGLLLPAIKNGHLIGGQIYPRTHIEHRLGRTANIPAGLGKYIWLSSSKQGGVNAHTSDTNENPLFLREYPGTDLDAIENLNLCEGALKSAIAALKFEALENLDPFLGAAGAWFSPKELGHYLERYPNLKTVTLWPDAGSIHNQATMNSYQRAIALVEQLTAGRVKTLVAWWGQDTKKSRDVDELNGNDLKRLTIEPWSVSAIIKSALAEVIGQGREEEFDSRPRFVSSIEEGLVRVSFKKDDDEGLRESRESIGNHLIAIAYVDSPEEDGSCLLLEFKTIRGKVRRWTMPRADLAGEGSTSIGQLLQRGYGFQRKQKNALLEYIHSLGSEVEDTYTVTDSTGWVDKSFVMPHLTYGDTTLRFRDVEPSLEAITELLGTLEGWQKNVAAMCAGNSRLIFALGTALAAPLLPLVGIESGGFHLIGATSQGKTTVLSVAASVVGIKDIPHWRTTTNGLESTATAFNHLLLPLDEIGQADPRDVGNIAYMLANGQGKARMKRDLTNRKGKTWQLMVLSSGEVGLGNYMKQANITQKGGQEVRMPDIPAVPKGSAYGCFETIHGADTAPQFVAALEAAVKQHHGTALDAFLSRLVVDAGNPRFAGNLAKQVQSIAAKLSQDTVDSAIGRVAKRFALVQVALSLAHGYGLIPIPVEQIDWAISCLFEDWMEARGGEGSIEVKQACERIEHLLVTNEFSDRVYDLRGGSGQPVRNLLAYKKTDKDGAIEELWVPTSVFDKEFCDGVNKSELIKELQRKNWLIQPRLDGKSIHQRKINGKPNYYYVFRIGEKCREAGEAGEAIA